MSGKTPEIEKKINDNVIAKKALELIAEKGNPIIKILTAFIFAWVEINFLKKIILTTWLLLPIIHVKNVLTV